MKVKATNQYEKLNLKDRILNRIPKEGEEFEVSEERYIELTQTNKYNAIFVEQITEEITSEEENETEEVETAIIDEQSEKAVPTRTIRKKKKANDI